MTFTGDILIAQNFAGDTDISFDNGQPIMTDGFESCVILAIFGEPCILNAATDIESERFVSTFPAVIRRANVNDETRQNGEKAIEKALVFMIADGMASTVECIGSFPTARTIAWEIKIQSPNGITKYSINWEKGSLTAGFSRVQ